MPNPPVGRFIGATPEGGGEPLAGKLQSARQASSRKSSLVLRRVFKHMLIDFIKALFAGLVLWFDSLRWHLAHTRWRRFPFERAANLTTAIAPYRCGDEILC